MQGTFAIRGKWVPLLQHGASPGCGRSNGLQLWWVAVDVLNK